MDFVEQQEWRSFTSQRVNSELRLNNIWTARELLQRLVHVDIHLLRKIGEDEWVAAACYCKPDSQDRQVTTVQEESNRFRHLATQIKDKILKMLEYLSDIPMPMNRFAVTAEFGREQINVLKQFSIIKNVHTGWIKLKAPNEIELSQIVDSLMSQQLVSGRVMDPHPAIVGNCYGMEHIGELNKPVETPVVIVGENTPDMAPPRSHMDTGTGAICNGAAVAINQGPVFNIHNYNNCNIQVGDNNTMNVYNESEEEE